MRKDKLTRLERATRAGRDMALHKEILLSHMAQLSALADGEEPPPPHPLANDPRFRGTVCGGVHTIKGGSSPVEDLSEPEEVGDPLEDLSERV